MSRRSNLNTLRKSFSRSSHWTSSKSYVHAVLPDNKITEYLIGLFYVLKMPTSQYVIRRFFNSLVLIETDVWLFNINRIHKFVRFTPLSYRYFYYIRRMLRVWRRNQVRPYVRHRSRMFKRVFAIMRSRHTFAHDMRMVEARHIASLRVYRRAHLHRLRSGIKRERRIARFFSRWDRVNRATRSLALPSSRGIARMIAFLRMKRGNMQFKHRKLLSHHPKIPVRTLRKVRFFTNQFYYRVLAI